MPIYVHRNNQQLGPFTAVEVKTQLASGALSIHDHVWWEGQNGWVPLWESSLVASGFKEVAGTVQRAPKPLTGRSPWPLGSIACGVLSAAFLIITSIPAIILGHLALREIRRNPGRTGRGLAIAGLVIGYVITLLVLVIGASYFLLQPGIDQVTREDALTSQVSTPELPTNSVPPTPAPPVVAPNPAPVVTNPSPASNGANQATPTPVPANLPPAQPAPVSPAPIASPNPAANAVPVTNPPDVGANGSAPTANAPDMSTGIVPSATVPAATTNAPAPIITDLPSASTTSPAPSASPLPSTNAPASKSAPLQ